MNDVPPRVHGLNKGLWTSKLMEWLERLEEVQRRSFELQLLLLKKEGWRIEKEWSPDKIAAYIEMLEQLTKVSEELIKGNEEMLRMEDWKTILSEAEWIMELMRNWTMKPTTEVLDKVSALIAQIK